MLDEGQAPCKNDDFRCHSNRVKGYEHSIPAYSTVAESDTQGNALLNACNWSQLETYRIPFICRSALVTPHLARCKIIEAKLSHLSQVIILGGSLS